MRYLWLSLYRFIINFFILECVPATLIVPQLNRLIEASFVRDESSASNADATTAIPSQDRVTQQILSH
jgi:hypothetical protein